VRTLCYVNHYFGAAVDFEGKSTNSRHAATRKAVVERCIASLKSIPGVDVYVCGIKGRSVVPIDLDFSGIAKNPRLLIYESLAHMAGHLDEYDYFINIEDDILVSADTLANVIAFDQSSLVNEVLHPNRVETDERGETFCVDTRSMPGWGHQRRTYAGHELRVARNPHSAVVILSREKFKYAMQFIDTSYRERFLVWELDSAFAYYNSPFALLRPYDDLSFHSITHLDRWVRPRTLRRFVYQVVPPILLVAYHRARYPDDPANLVERWER
jgi:hypothetical protein